MVPFYFNVYALSFFLAACLFLFSGLYVLAQSSKSAMHISFFAIFFSTACWLGATTLLLISRDPFWIRLSYKGIYLGVSFISVSVFAYSSTWLGYYQNQKRLIWVGYAIGLILTLFIWFTPWIVYGYMWHPWGPYSLLTPGGGALYLLYFMVYAVFAFRNFLKGYREAGHPLLKRQLRLVLIGFIIAYLGTVDFLPCYGFNIFPIGAFSTMILVGFLGYTIVRYKLLDIETVIHMTLMWMMSTIIAVLPFAVILNGIRHIINQFPAKFQTAVYISFFILFFYYFRWIQPLLNQWFRRRHSNLQAVLNRFSSELEQLKDLGDLLRHFVRLLRRNLYTKQVVVYLRDESEEFYIPVIAKGIRGLKPFPISHPFLSWLEKHNQIILSEYVRDNPELQSMLPEFDAFMKELSSVVLVPFVLGQKLLGFSAIGKRENLKRFRIPEMQFLSQLKVPVTIALSNSIQFDHISRLYIQVQVQNERLKELDRLKTEFLANTSHELRTPLHGIVGLVEAILDGADGPINDTQSKHLRMIVESGANLKELINNLLELSRLESGQIKLQIKPFNISSVIDAVVSLLQSLAIKKKITLSAYAAGHFSDVYGDPEKIQRVLINLIANAIKFTERGTVRVLVQEEPDWVRVSVEDTGIGIRPEDQKIIFDRFRQADGSSTRRFEGTGLGLSIAQEIMRLHNGKIEVESQVGKGSRFFFLLSKHPFESEKSDPDFSTTLTAASQLTGAKTVSELREKAGLLLHNPVYSLEKGGASAELTRGSGEKILIIDDNSVNREIVRTRLEMNGYKTVEAVDGEDGLICFQIEKPDLIILDLMMPKMSGYEFCRQIRTQKEVDDIPIIMLTAKTDMGDKIYGFQIGANDYISKPFNKEELIARVSILLKIRRMKQELKKWNAELEKRVEERTRELVITQEQLVQAEKMATIGTLAGGIAHEINNPLTAVLTNAQLLKMTAPPEDVESIDLIEAGAKRCQSIIQKLMKYARKSPSEEPMKSVNLVEVVENTVALLRYQIEQENISLKFEIVPLPSIQGVSNELEQVFTNLIINARDAIKAASRPGEIYIKTALEHQNGNPSFIVVTVSDNGAGIKQAFIKKIFDPFFTTKEVGRGTGLGLAVTYGILEKHRCKVEVQSEEGKGTSFILRFPI